MNYLSNNLKRFPELTTLLNDVKAISDDLVSKTKDGNVTAKIDGKFIHSAYRPIDEGRRLIESYKIDDAPIVIVGFGFGYHVTELLKQEPGRKILVVERNLPVLKKAFELIDFSNLDGEVKFYLQDEPKEIMSDYEFYTAINNKPTIIVHRVSTHFDIKFYQNLTDSILSVNEFNIDRKLKISVVSPIMGGSISVGKYVDVSLKRLGVEVDYIDNTQYYDMYKEINERDCSKEERLKSKEVFHRFVTDSIRRRVDTFKPDLVFAMAQAPMSVRLLNYLEANEIKTAFWFVENFRHITYWQYMAAYYDYFFTIQKGEFFNVLEQSGVRNYYYLPLGAAPTIHERSLIEKYDHDLSFVGAGYKNRQNFFEKVMDMEPTLPLKIWGNEWDPKSKIYSLMQKNGERLELDEMFDTYAKSKIVVNLHSSTDESETLPKSDKDFLNPRIFELAAMGVFQLVDEREIIGDFFEVGKEIVTFKDEKDFIEKVRYYLKNDLERKEIAIQARAKVLNQHTYDKRMTDMLTRVYGMGVLKSLCQPEDCKILDNDKRKVEEKVTEKEPTFDQEQAIDLLCDEMIREQNVKNS